MNEFIKVINGYGNNLGVAFMINCWKIVFTLILKSKNFALLTLAVPIPDTSTKSMSLSGSLMIVKTGVFMHLINQPLKTSLYSGNAFLKS
jgi:hypothetical protein